MPYRRVVDTFLRNQAEFLGITSLGRSGEYPFGWYPRGWSISVVIVASEDGRENANS